MFKRFLAALLSAMLLLTAAPTLVNPKRKLVKAIPDGRILRWR